MKKFIGFISLIAATFVAIILASCQATYSASSIKSSLEGSGYSINEGIDIVFDDDVQVSTLTGVQKIYVATKGTGEDKEFSVIVVFDSISNLDAGITDLRLVDIGRNAERQLGENKASTLTIGKFNNVAFGGTSACKEAAGLR